MNMKQPNQVLVNNWMTYLFKIEHYLTRQSLKKDSCFLAVNLSQTCFSAAITGDQLATKYF